VICYLHIIPEGFYRLFSIDHRILLQTETGIFKFNVFIRLFMSRLKLLMSKHPIIAVISMAILWLVLLMVFAGMISGATKTAYGSATSMFWAHLLMFICVGILLWRLSWLKSSGIARPGKTSVWLLAVLGTIYSAITALYAFYGTLSFDFSTLKDVTVSLNMIRVQFAVSLDEETFFRGLILSVLILNTPGTIRGRMGSVVLMSVIFGLMHVLWVFFSGLSILSALFLALQTIIISIWWASLILTGGSIWPAFLAHFTVNTVIALQGVSHSVIQPDSIAYGIHLLFTLPLVMIAFWLIKQSSALQFRSAE